MIYIPKEFLISDTNKIKDFIASNSFATLVSCDANSISNITKTSLLFKETDGQMFLEGHFSRANNHYMHLIKSPELQIIFDGPHGYISPLLYSKPDMSVPTWNYSTVVLSGEATIISEENWILNSALELARKYEKTKEWEESIDKNLLLSISKGIIGVSIKITDFQGKFKLSQNKSIQDRDFIINSLKDSNVSLSNLMAKHKFC